VVLPATDVRTIADTIEAQAAEMIEQARIIGMGAERELALRAENERLRAGRDAALEKLDPARFESYVQGLEDAAKVARQASLSMLKPDAIADAIRALALKEPRS
jgi:hypothetical protein